MKSIDDTSNFDDFPDADLRWRKHFFQFSLVFFLAVPPDMVKPGDEPGRRGEFVDFTYNRFDGLTQKARYDPKKISRGSESNAHTQV